MLEKIAELIAEQLHVSPGMVITEDTSFKQDLRADSFELMELVMALEEEFGIEIPTEEAEKIVTVNDAVELIKKATNA